MTVVIDNFVDYLDLSFVKQYYKSNGNIGGRPPYEFGKLMKMYLYSLYKGISIRNLKKENTLGSQLHFLSQNYPDFPDRKTFTEFLKHLDNHIFEVFDSCIKYLQLHTCIDLSCLYNDGTIFEAHNNRHKIITDTNIVRSNKKWNKIMNDENSSEQLKEIAKNKLDLNKERMEKLVFLNRKSYGRTDADSVILKAKNGTYIAGYNAQFVEEAKHGFIVYPYVSNKNPDSVAFLDVLEDIVKKYEPKKLIVDMGYGTPEIITKLTEFNVEVVVRALKNENSKKKINEYSFDLSENDDCLGKKGRNSKSVNIILKEFKAMKKADAMINSEIGKELYLHRGNICESPNGFIMYNLNGGKLKMNGLDRATTIIFLYVILYNLRRLISVKSVGINQQKN